MNVIEKLRAMAAYCDYAECCDWDQECMAIAAAELDRLRAYVEADCRCPCCNTTRHCLGECTFRDDAADAWERMAAARVATWGDVSGKVVEA